jgi:hypothetical protein
LNLKETTDKFVQLIKENQQSLFNQLELINEKSQ